MFPGVEGAPAAPPAAIIAGGLALEPLFGLLAAPGSLGLGAAAGGAELPLATGGALGSAGDGASPLGGAELPASGANLVPVVFGVTAVGVCSGFAASSPQPTAAKVTTSISEVVRMAITLE
jgi:hypothetical protein